MAASTSGALKALIEGAGLNLAVYRDRYPEKQNATYPHVIVHEAISITPEVAFSQLDDPEGHVTEQAQVDLWERWRDSTTGELAESYTLADELAQVLRGAQLPTSPNHVAAMRLLEGPFRLLEGDANLVRKSFTVEIRRTLERD